jgi:hypothetical protein
MKKILTLDTVEKKLDDFTQTKCGEICAIEMEGII